MRPRVSVATAACIAALAACNSDKSTGPSRPAAPTGVAATASGATTVHVGFTAVSGATKYLVQRATGSAGSFAVVGAPTTAGFDDANLEPSSSYRYQVATIRGTDTSGYSVPVSVTTLAPGLKSGLLNANVTADRTLFADTTYVLSGFIKVTNGATLTIQPGTKIVGDTTVLGSSLWITRGAKIEAIGTAANPIVFTSQRSAGNRKPGDWGGIIIVGNGVINRTGATITTEGPQGVAENYAGGTNNADSSGTLKYVRVEFAGYALQPNEELNSVSSYAVGSKTHYDYVQSMAGLDDAFEFFGGAVQIRHMVSYESGDDHFDWTEGYQGKGQYLIALQTTVIQPRSGAGFVSTDPRGFEGDGCETNKPGCASYTATPFSEPVWANFTVIGPGPGVFATNDGNGAVIRRGSGGTLINGIIARWPGIAIDVRDQASSNLIDVDSLVIRNLVLADNGANFDPAGTNFGQATRFAGNNIREVAGSASALFAALPAAGTAPTVGTLDWSLAANSPARTGGLTTFSTAVAARLANFFDASIQGTTYIGAADPAGSKWWDGWTVYYRN